jgi:hypothetical protein
MRIGKPICDSSRFSSEMVVSRRWMIEATMAA